MTDDASAVVVPGVAVPQHTIGTARLTVPALALGSWHTWSRAVFEDVVTIVRSAVDAGAGFFDIAVYRAGFDNDTPTDSATDIIIAHALEVAGVSRDEYLLSIKGWHEPTARGRSLTQQTHEALRRIHTDHADILVVESIDYAPDFELESAIEQVGALIAEGAIRHWGVNNWSASQLRSGVAEAKRQGVEGPQLAQMIYGVGRRTIPEGEPFREAVAETGVGVQASDIFDGGLLIGKGTERHLAGDPGGIRDAMRVGAPRLSEVAASLGATAAQFGLALPLTNPQTANVLVGVRTPDQFNDLLGAFALLERVGPDTLREAADEFWYDRDVMNPEVGGQ